MDNCDYVLDGDLAFSNPSAALKFYQTEYHKQKDRIAELELQLGVEEYLHKKLATEPIPNPLTDDEIRDLEQKYIEVELFDEGEYGTEYNVYGVKDLIKEVERIHGIK